MSWFNAQDHNPELAPPQMPIGKHPVQIVNSGTRAVGDGASSGALSLSLFILDGPNTGQTGNILLNIWNKNDTSREIAARQLSAICHVTGVYNLVAKPEGVELWNKPFIIEIAQQPDSKYVQLAGVFDIHGNAPQKVGQGSAPSQAQPPAQQFGGQPAPAYQPPAAQGPAPAPAWGSSPQQGPAPAAAPGWQGQPQPAPAQQPAAAPAWQQQPAAGTTAPSWQR